MENWRVIPISAFNYVIVEVVADIGNYLQYMICLSIPMLNLTNFVKRNELLTIISIFIYNNEIIYEVQCNRYFMEGFRSIRKY